MNRILVTLLILLTLGLRLSASSFDADNIAILPSTLDSIAPDSISPPLPRKDNPNFWINRIKAHNYNIADTTIIYPKFPGFCVKVYNWADRTFNTFDHDYVLPTGKKWKVIWRSTNWTDSYSLDLRSAVKLRMLSDVYMSTGPYLSFMAVTIGYGVNLNNIFFHEKARQKRFDFSFSCALFELNLFYTQNNDGTRIRRFSPFDDGHIINVKFPSLHLENYGAAAFYFLNHKRYYQGAAYNYSKIQKRSQGSWLFGLSFSHQYIDFDLNTLPDDMRKYLMPDDPTHYRFVYNDYCFLAGYGYNWVFNPHWVFNVTALPAVGIKDCLADNGDGRKVLPAVNLTGRLGLAYNLQNFFVGLYGSGNANWYLNQQYSFINALFSGGFAVGLRF